MTDFRFHPEAEIDLNEIWDFIAEDSIDAADRVRDNIFAAIQDLAQTPNRGHRRGDLTSWTSAFDLSGEPYSRANSSFLTRPYA